MAQASGWSVDQVAARKLLAALGVEATDTAVELVARHFSDHRRAMLQWAADRVHANILRVLETASTDNFAYHDEEWVRGFSRAEELLFTLSPAELLDLEPEQTRSKGQILRAMVRKAKSS